MGRRKGRSSRKPPERPGRFAALLAGSLFGQPVDEPLRERLQEIKGLVFLSLSIWLLISLATYWTPPGDPRARGLNWGGDAGFYVANMALIAFGLSSYILAALVGLWGCILVARRAVTWPFIRLMGGLCLIFALSLILQLGFGPTPAELEARQLQGLIDNELPYGPGGWLAIEVTPRLVARFGDPGLWVLLVTMAGVSFMLATEMAFYPALRALAGWVRERREERGESLGSALWSWLKGLVQGLWDFVRGADLVESTALAGSGRGGRRAGGGGATRKAGRSRKGRKAERAEPPASLDEDEDTLEESEAEVEGTEAAGEADGDPELDAEEEAPEDVWADEEGPQSWELGGADEDELADELDGEDDEIVPAARAPRTTLQRPVYEPPTPPPGPWTLPPIELLEPPAGDFDHDRDFLERSARSLENALKSFRVEAEVVGAQVGPAVTMFELTVAQGTRMNRVTQLSQEIAATLRARSVRIIAPIPGKSTIGIEVPNKKRRTVRISELISQKAYDKDFMALPLFLGMDAEGNAIVEDLARCPHMLIAGTTGSGKSVCINTILASFLLTRSPHDVRLILVDPKMVELQMFANVPHLELPVVTDMRQATNVLLWAVEKMESRYELFKDAGVKSIKAFNALGEAEVRRRLSEGFDESRTPRHVPYIVLVIDEMADLMMQSKKEAELAITRLAQKSRAVGIHVIVATQRPSTDVITGVIKGNLPTRIAFQVASKVDSRVILDAMGAEKLLGQGDMLYTPPQSSALRRVQGALVEDHELQALVDFVCRDSIQRFNQELVQTATGSAPPGDPVGQALEADDRFDEAVRVILRTRRGSASLLQRAMGIGYTRASRLIDLMTEAGIVGEHKGSKSREILMDLDDWEEMHTAVTGQGMNDG